MRSGGFAGIATAAALLIAAPGAAAETFCVEKPSCDGTNQVTLQDAITAAGQTQGIPDRIELGKASFEEGPYTASDDNPVKIVGSGRKHTTLKRSTNATFQTVLSLNDSESTVSRLTVDVGDGDSSRGLLLAGKASDVLVKSTSASVNQNGLYLQGGSLKKSTVKLSNSSGSLGISMASGAKAREISVQATQGINGAGEVDRARVTAVELGIASDFPGLEIDQATVLVTGTGATALRATSGAIATTPTVTTARHVTLVGDPSDGGTGAEAVASPALSFLGGSAELTLRNAIIRGFADDVRRVGAEGNTCPPGCPAAASVDVAWTVYHPAKITDSGPGTFTVGAGNRNTDPRLVNPEAGDYRLKASSKLIDTAQKTKPAAGESKVDLDGRKRVADGDGNGKARRDYGAFERPKP